MDLDTETIKEICNKDVSIIKELLPCATRRGVEFVAGSVSGDKGDSFSYNSQSGRWADFATGETGTSIIDLIIAQKHCSVREAFDFCRERIGANPVIPPKKEKPKKETNTALPIPDGVFPQFVYKDGVSHRISRFWSYVGKDGKTYGFDARVDYPDGSKDVIPFIWSEDEHRLKQGMLPAPRMLCGIKDIDDYKSVMIVEGCKTRDAAKTYFPNWCVLTWQGGCKAVAKSDWSVIKDKNVVIVPDADAKKDAKGKLIDWSKQCGYEAAVAIAEKLCKDNRVRIVDTRSKGQIKDGWDLADALEAGEPQSDVVAFVKENLREFVGKKEKEEDVNVVIEKKEEDDEVTYDDTYFRCLGERGSSTFFFKYASGQVIEFTPSKYDSKHMVSLAPLSFWEAYFMAKNGVDWLQACDFYSRIQERIGYFNATNVRGRGCWFDNDHIVLHLGKSLIVDGMPTTLRSFKTKNIYEQREPISVNTENPMPAFAAKKLIDVCKLARWEEDYSGEILAGWIFSAMVCGAMKFRSHLYLIGQSGSGKSWLQDHLIKPIMGKMCVHVSSKTTEAGIRALLNNDILPIVCDENEKEDSKKDSETLQAIFDLARNASSEHSEPIIKSSPTGQIKVYYCRSAFLFASIKTSMEKVADLNRTAFIRLKNKPAEEATQTEKDFDSAKFEKLRTSVEALIDNDYCESLLARAVRLAGVMRKSQQVVSDVSAKIYGDRRQGDQMGMIIAGLWGLQSDFVIDELAAKRYLDIFTKNKERVYSSEDDKQEQGCLDSLMRMPVKIQSHSYPLSRVLSFVLGFDAIEENKIEVERILAYGGIKVSDKKLYLSTKITSEHCVYFSQQTMYGTKGWIDELFRCSPKARFENTRFTKVSFSRALVLPIEEIIKTEKEDMPL